MPTDKIIIRDLAAWYRVGVTDEERARPQRLLIDIELHLDVSQAAETDDLKHTIDYYAVAQRLLHWGENRQWNLIEKLASDIAQLLLREFAPQQVAVEVKKMVLPEASYVSVQVIRPAKPRRV